MSGSVTLHVGEDEPFLWHVEISDISDRELLPTITVTSVGPLCKPCHTTTLGILSPAWPYISFQLFYFQIKVILSEWNSSFFACLFQSSFFSSALNLCNSLDALLYLPHSWKTSHSYCFFFPIASGPNQDLHTLNNCVRSYSGFSSGQFNFTSMFSFQSLLFCGNNLYALIRLIWTLLVGVYALYISTLSHWSLMDRTSPLPFIPLSKSDSSTHFLFKYSLLTDQLARQKYRVLSSTYTWAKKCSLINISQSLHKK